MKEKIYIELVIIRNLLIILLACVFVDFIISDPPERISYQTEGYPTAGVTRYLAELERSCMDAAPRISGSEEQIDTVAVNEVEEESDIPETEEEVVEDGRSMERDDCLSVYFGYYPSDDEIELWERVVMAECGYTEPDAGVIAVADCIANRCRSARFPNGISEVVYQTNQFETVANGRIWQYQVTDRVLDICERCIERGPVYDYLFFTAGQYNPYCEPGEIIGNHYFGY